MPGPARSAVGLVSRRAIGVMALSAWVVVVLFGFLILGRYGAVPGPTPGARAAWPEAADLELAQDRPTLLMFAHPRCPCTRASLSELDRILSRAAVSSRVVVLLRTPEVVPARERDDWMRTSLWTQARRLPGAVVRADPGGRIAALFGVSTSGTTLIFGPDEQLRYSGGTTFARGHEGVNTATSVIVAALRGTADGVSTSPVFGCLLFDADDDGQYGLRADVDPDADRTP